MIAEVFEGYQAMVSPQNGLSTAAIIYVSARVRDGNLKMISLYESRREIF